MMSSLDGREPHSRVARKNESRSVGMTSLMGTHCDCCAGAPAFFALRSPRTATVAALADADAPPAAQDDGDD